MRRAGTWSTAGIAAVLGAGCGGGRQETAAVVVTPRLAAPAAESAASPVATPGAVACAELAKMVLPHVTIGEAKVVPAAPRTDKTPALPTYCRVLGTSRPTTDSEIGFEVAIPEGAAWNGRFEQVGNGGFRGSIYERRILDALAHGYATAGTDNGHRGRSADCRWALGHPEKIVDFGYRARKETTTIARAVIRANRGEEPRFSYFNGCSMGGREALDEAQRYPDDFDGIIAGAAATNLTHLLFGNAWNALTVMGRGETQLPASKLKAIQTAARRACADGDGVIEDPVACRFDPATLLCHGAETDECLTRAQVTTLRKIYTGPRNPRTGEQIAPGLEPGGEAEEDGWGADIVLRPGEARGDTAQYTFGVGFFRDMVFEDESYDLHRLDFDRDVARVDAKLASTLSAFDPDLHAFKKRGGKLLQYQGWLDADVPPRQSIAYFDRVHATMGDTGDFYRLFMAPGMEHCGGGPGPNELSVREAITAWVEHGTAPDRLLATKYQADDTARPVLRQRPLCPYPSHAVAMAGASADPKSADGFVCAPATPR